jgi:hypothetical protein
MLVMKIVVTSWQNLEQEHFEKTTGKLEDPTLNMHEVKAFLEH